MQSIDLVVNAKRINTA